MRKSSNALVTFSNRICFERDEKDIMKISAHKDAQRINQLRQVVPLSKVSNTLIATSLKSLEIRMC
jgi:hypothetical protein